MKQSAEQGANDGSGFRARTSADVELSRGFAQAASPSLRGLGGGLRARSSPSLRAGFAFSTLRLDGQFCTQCK